MSAAETSSALLRAASRKHSDPSAIVKTAQEAELPPKQLALIVDRLREAHPKFRLPKADRDPLIDALLAEDVSATDIASRLGCSRPTVAKRAEALRANPVDGLDKPSKCKETGVCGCPPILSFDASSGAHMTRGQLHSLLVRLGYRSE